MRPDFNFSPKPFARRNLLKRMLMLVNIMLALAFGFSLFYLYSVHQDRGQHQQAFTDLEQQQNLLSQEFEQVSFELEGLDLRSYDRELRFYAQIQQEMRIPWVLLIDTLAKMLPDGVRVQHFTSEGLRSSDGDSPHLQILAEARNKSDQLKFLKAIRSNDQFKNVLLMTETYEGEQVQFEFGFQYQGGQHARL